MDKKYGGNKVAFVHEVYKKVMESVVAKTWTCSKCGRKQSKWAMTAYWNYNLELWEATIKLRCRYCGSFELEINCTKETREVAEGLKKDE